jgi:hypothetical protein
MNESGKRSGELESKEEDELFKRDYKSSISVLNLLPQSLNNCIISTNYPNVNQIENCIKELLRQGMK